MNDVANGPVHPWVAEGINGPRFGVQMNVLPDWGATRDFAQAAEGLGFDALWRADHPAMSSSAPWTSLAALAEATRTIRLGTLVSCVYYWNPMLVARMVADIDRIAGGRMVVGLGSGNMPPEFRQLGLEFPPPAERHAALGEALQIIQPLLRGERVSVRGARFSAEDAALMPPPIQQPYVPLLLGGGGERGTLDLVARYADAINLGPAPWAGGVRTSDDAERKFGVLRQRCAEAGRPFESVLRTTMIGLCLSHSPGTLQEKLDRVPPPALDLFRQGAVIGSPDDAARRVQALVETGFQYVIFLVFAFDQETLRLVAEQVVPAVLERHQSRRLAMV
jgi:alkanesulfonate monooxygenase SsuD/methylene tetrahydromethanopterin reductase-like flavin-dependent oxidoreductase (luciferase family)